MNIPRVVTSRPANATGFSLYLDALRVMAAIGVLMSHLRLLQIGPAALRNYLPGFGHEFVVVFFVLSGYVIAAAVERKRDASIADYGLDRFSRIYSVALPALLLSTAVSFSLSVMGGEHANGAGSHAQILSGLLWNLPMLGQFWFVDNVPPSNPPVWSLCYESMYYALFGCVMYLRGWRRWFSTLLVAALAGPKVLLLMPCWLVGVAVYHLRDRWPMKRWAAIFTGVVLPAIVFLAMSKLQLGRVLIDWGSGTAPGLGIDLARSASYPKDFVTALLVGLNLYAIRTLDLEWGRRFALWVRACAALTFTLYLLHYPALLIVKAAFGAASASVSALAVALGLVVCITYFIGSITELKLPALRLKLRMVCQRVGVLPPRPTRPE